MLPAINIGPLVFPTAALVYIFGAWISLSLIERAAQAVTTHAETVYNLAIMALFSGIAGARLVFVALHWSAYQENLLGIIWPLNTGFNVWGGLVVGATAAFFYGRYQRVHLPTTLDALAPGFVVLLIVVSLADFLAGPGYGTLTAVPWSITRFNVSRHPVQIYEILVGITALFLWWYTIDRRSFDGQLFLLTAMVYSGGRLFVDAFRHTTWITGGFHIVQIISLGVMLISLFLLAKYSPRKAKP